MALMDWFRANRLTLNLEKMACILFRKGGKKQELRLEIDGIAIDSTQNTKFLGLWLDSHLNWSMQMSKLFTKIKQNKALLRLGKNLLTEQARKLVYYVHINCGVIILTLNN